MFKNKNDEDNLKKQKQTFVVLCESEDEEENFEEFNMLEVAPTEETKGNLKKQAPTSVWGISRTSKMLTSKLS